MYIKHSSIKYVSLYRLKGNNSSKSFDLGIKMISGDQEVLFVNLEMGELKGIISYFKGVKVKVREGDVERDDPGGEIDEDKVEEDGSRDKILTKMIKKRTMMMKMMMKILMRMMSRKCKNKMELEVVILIVMKMERVI